MSPYRALVATAVQMLIVSIGFVITLKLPVSQDFFAQNGFIVGPGTWLVCSLLTGGFLRLALLRTVLAAALSGVVLAVAVALFGHVGGMILGAIVFGLTVGATAGRAGKVGAAGIEPAFSGLKGRRPNH